MNVMLRLIGAFALSAIAFGLWAAMTHDAPAQSPLAAEPAPTSTARVVDVIDGDTIVLANGEKVRYIGIDAPEMNGDAEPECMAQEAALRNEALVLGADVVLERDTSNTDDYQRLLRHVYLDETATSSVGYTLVREGLARATPIEPDTAHAARLFEAQQAAQTAGVGLWAPDACDTDE